jgi:cell division protein FtsZ
LYSPGLKKRLGALNERRAKEAERMAKYRQSRAEYGENEQETDGQQVVNTSDNQQFKNGRRIVGATNTFVGATEVEKPMDEPFIKTEFKAEELRPTSVSDTPRFEEPKIEAPKAEVTSTPAAEISFDWEVSNTASASNASAEPRKEEVKRFMLEDEMSSVDLDNMKTKTVLSPEEQQRKTQERMSKIHEYTAKLKKAEGITEFENEPAYVRRNIQLNNSKPSTEESFSRFGLSEEEDRGVLRNNNFLHDNVD